jgi:hypothetical protein
MFVVIVFKIRTETQARRRHVPFLLSFHCLALLAFHQIAALLARRNVVVLEHVLITPAAEWSHDWTHHDWLTGIWIATLIWLHYFGRSLLH